MMAVQRAVPAATPQFSGAILVAEDNPVNQDVIRAALETYGCAVRITKNGREALDAIQQSSFDLVFMDCQMPEMDGYAATRAIRALEQNGILEAQRVPIIALTAHATHADRERCISAGMDSFLSKPFTQAVLCRELERWLNGTSQSDTGRDQQKTQTVPPATTETLNGGTLNELRLLDPAGAKGLLSELVQAYLGHTKSLLAGLRVAIAAETWPSVEAAAHKIRSGSLTIGASRVATIGRTRKRKPVKSPAQLPHPDG